MEEKFDIAVLDEALLEDEEVFPKEILKALLDGISPVRVFRTYRDMTQQQLADRAGVTKRTISEIETGRKYGSVKTLVAIANTLNVTLDDLVD